MAGGRDRAGTDGAAVQGLRDRVRREPGNRGSPYRGPARVPGACWVETPAGTPPSFSPQWRRVPTLWAPVISPPGWSLADTFPLLRNMPRPRLPKPLPLQCPEARRPLPPRGNLALLFLQSVCSSPPPPWRPLLQMTVFRPFPGGPHAPAQWAQTWCLLGAGTLTSGFSLWFPNHKPSWAGCNCP